MRKIACLILITLPSIALPDVKYVVIGLDETLTENVLSHVDMVQFGPRARFRPRDHDKVVEKSIADARAALRPFGYYAPLISVSIRQPQTGSCGRRRRQGHRSRGGGPPFQGMAARMAVT
jgi:hypothetical protein